MIRRRRAMRISRGGTLALIASLMIGSALVRFGIAAAPAIAREVGASQADPPAPAPPADGSETLSAARAAPAEAELDRLLAAFQQRERALRVREVEIEDRMKALSIAGRSASSIGRPRFSRASTM